MHENPSHNGMTVLLEEDGNECFSRLDLALWRICIDVRHRYAADIIFTHTDPSYLGQTDGYIEFFVPRHHPQFSGIVEDLREQIEPVRRSLQEHHASRNMSWTPTEFAYIRPYSGVADASAHLEASVAAFRKQVAQSHHRYKGTNVGTRAAATAIDPDTKEHSGGA